MTLVARHANPSITTPAPAFNHRLAGGHEGWKAGEALDAADACTLHSDGRVYKADGAAADANARIYGWTAGPCPVGEAVTLFDHVTFGYAAGGLTPGTAFYLSGDTPGRLDTEPSPGGTVPCAVALDSTRVHVQSTWGGGASSSGGALDVTYLALPAIPAPDPMTQSLNHAWVYLDSADMTLQALINGTVTPLGERDPLTLGTPDFTFPWDGGGGARPRLVVGPSSANPFGATAVAGSDVSGYTLDGFQGFSDSGSGMGGFSNSGPGLNAESHSGEGVRATSNTGNAVYGDARAGGGAAVYATGGPVFVADQSAPATPTDGIVIWSEGGALKWKGPDGVVH